MSDPQVVVHARAAWSVALDRPIDADTDFFDAGGTSLAAMQIIASLEEACRTRVPLRVIFDHPRFDDFVTALVHLRHASGEHPRV